MSNSNSTRKVYMSVVEDVISNVREFFLDESVDEQVLQELKQLWESKLTASRALEPPEPEPTPGTGNIPYQLMQQPATQSTPHVSTIQQQIPVPVQLTSDGQISNAAGLAFSAHGTTMYSHQGVPTLVNLNPGSHLTLQQTANGQYILQALPQGVGQGVTQAQMVLPQQAIVQAQSAGQIQGQTVPQFDGALDEKENSTTGLTETHQTSCQTLNHTTTLPDDSNASPATDRLLHNIDMLVTRECSGVGACGDELGTSCGVTGASAGVAGACGGTGVNDSAVELEVEVSPKLSCKLQRDLRRKHRKTSISKLSQLDGNHDTSSSEDDNFDDDDDDDNNDDDDKEDGEDEGEEEEPLNSGDDVSDDDPTELFDTDNVVVCQFEKISRNKGKWKFFLKDGIMNLDGKDHVFQRGNGEADW